MVPPLLLFSYRIRRLSVQLFILRILHITESLRLLARSHELRGPHPPPVLGGFHVLVDQLLDLPGIFYVFQVQMGDALVRGHHAHRPHAEDALTQGHVQLKVPHPVEQNLVGFDVEKSGLAEQPVLAEPVAGEGQGQSKITLAVLPQLFDGFHSVTSIF